LLAHSDDLVAFGLLERFNKAVYDIHEHYFETRVVEEFGDEATANIACTEVNALLACHLV
jgi:hypothetical protein